MNFREQIEKRRGSLDSTAANDNKQDEKLDFHYFGIENYRSTPACINLRLANGNCKALPYTYIVEVNFDASDGIEIRSSASKVKITGRDLGKLYEYLAAFRVKYIQETQGTDASEPGLFIKKIVLEEL